MTDTSSTESHAKYVEDRSQNKSSVIGSYVKTSRYTAREDPYDVESDTSISYEDIISNGFKSVKYRSAKDSNKTKIKMEKSEKGSSGDNKTKTRNIHTSNDYNQLAKNEMFFCSITDETQDETGYKSVDSSASTVAKDDNEILVYTQPQSDAFQIQLSEKDNLIFTERKPFKKQQKATENQRYLEEGLYVYRNPKSKHYADLLGQKFDDRKWFGDNDVGVLENPLTRNSVRPEKDAKVQIDFDSSANQNYKGTIIATENILEMYISLLKFRCHPLFSIEHFLAEHLYNLYDQYTCHMKNNTMVKIKTQIDALKYLKNKLENESAADNFTMKRIKRISTEIKNLRKKYFDQGKTERENLKSILSTWKQIKDIRKKQKFSNTNINLIINAEEVDYEADVVRYKKLFRESLEEATINPKAELQKISGKMSISRSKPVKEDSDESSSENKDSDIRDKSLHEKIEKIFHESIRAPGEPVLKLTLSTTDSEVTEVVDNENEILRRHAAKSVVYFLNIYYNKMLICRSKAIKLNANFELDVNETFCIRLEEIPKYLHIEILEKPRNLLSKKLCDVAVKVPNQNSFSVKSNVKLTFESTEAVPYKNKDLANIINVTQFAESLNLTNSLDGNYKLTPSGYIECCMRWTGHFMKKCQLVDQTGSFKEISNKNCSIDANKLSEWISYTLPDPQDPRNHIFHDQSASYDLKTFKNKDKFRLSVHLQNLKFCSLHEIKDNIRLSNLETRDKSETDLDGIIIQNRIKDTSRDKPDKSKKRKSRVNMKYDIKKEIESLRIYENEYFKHVQIKSFERHNDELVYDNVVHEKYEYKPQFCSENDGMCQQNIGI